MCNIYFTYKLLSWNTHIFITFNLCVHLIQYCNVMHKDKMLDIRQFDKNQAA